MADAKIPLSELIESVSVELHNAQDKAVRRGEALMLFEGCEFEFGVEVEKSADGGVHVWVVDLSGGVKKTETNTITVKFKANPQSPLQAPSETTGAGPVLKKKERL